MAYTKRAVVLSPWVKEVVDGQMYQNIAFASDFTDCKAQDITGQDSTDVMSDPPIVTLLVECNEETLEEVDGHPDYEIIHCEDIEQEVEVTP